MESFETSWAHREDAEIPRNVRQIVPFADGLEPDFAASVTSVSVTVDEKPKDTVIGTKAKNFLSLIEGGKPPAAAAKAVGVPLQRILTHPDMQASVTRIVSAGRLSNEIRKELVRAGLNLGLAETAEAGDWDLFNKLAKTVSTDPDVGLNLPPQPTVSIDLGCLGDILTGVTLPGIAPAPPVEITAENPPSA